MGVSLKVTFRPRAAEDLERLYIFIRDTADAGPDIAIRFVLSIQEQCARLADMPERAPLRPEVGEDVRVLSMKRRISIAYRVRRTEVEILGIFYRGQVLDLDPPGEK